MTDAVKNPAEVLQRTINLRICQEETHASLREAEVDSRKKYIRLKLDAIYQEQMGEAAL